MKRFRLSPALALLAGLSVPARAGLLDLPESEALRASREAAVSTAAFAARGEGPRYGLAAPAPASLRLLPAPSLPAGASLEGGYSEAMTMFDGASRSRSALTVSPAPAEVLPPLRPTPSESGVTSMPKPRGKSIFEDDPVRRKWFMESLQPRDRYQSQYLLGDGVHNGAMRVFDPTFRVINGVSDRIFDGLSIHLLARVLPSKMYKDIDRSKKRPESAQVFSVKFSEKLGGTMRQMYYAFPRAATSSVGSMNNGYSQPGDMNQYQQWQREMGDRMVSDSIDALKDTMLARYQLEQSGHKIGEKAKDRGNWSPSFIALAGVVGGGLLWVNGINTPVKYHEYKLDVRLSAASKIVGAVQNDGDSRRVAGLELGKKDFPVSAYTDLGVDHGDFRAQVYGLRISNRFVNFPFDKGPHED